MLNMVNSAPPNHSANAPHATETVVPPIADACAPAVTAKTRIAVFEDLPAELVGNVASHVFLNSATDPAHRITSLNCNLAMRSTLASELRAGEVLQNIQASPNLTALSAALTEVPTVFAPCRHGCLRAALHLLPRINRERVLPEALWTQLGELFATVVPAADAVVSDLHPREDLLMQLAGTLRQTDVHSMSNIEHVFALASTASPLGPQLENALLQWAGSLLADPFYTGMDLPTMRERMMSAAPPGLRPRLKSLCDFSSLIKDNHNNAQSMLQLMAGNIEAIANVPADDLPNHIRIASGQWALLSRMDPVCKGRYLEVFSRLSPTLQLSLVRRNRSPFAPHEIPAFLQTLAGRLPAATLLNAASFCTEIHRPPAAREQEQLLHCLLPQSVGSPQLPDVLHAAVTSWSAREPRTADFIQQHALSVAEEDRLAIGLRLGLTAVGCGDSPVTPDGSLAAMSHRIDELLYDSGTPPAAMIETLASMKVGWLTPLQRRLLIDRVMALPQATAARLLQSIGSHIPHSYSQANARALLGRVLTACESLAPEHQAAPLASVLNFLRLYDGPEYLGIRQEASRVFHALPPAMRPLFDRRWRTLLAPAAQGQAQAQAHQQA